MLSGKSKIAIEMQEILYENIMPSLLTHETYVEYELKKIDIFRILLKDIM